MQVPVVINQASGSARQVTDEALAAAFATAGMPVDIIRVAPAALPEAFAKAAQAAASATGQGLLVAGGGDGTLNQAAAAAHKAGIALGVLPMGTFNNFARDLGMPLDPLAAAAAIATNAPRPVDLGWLVDRPFLNNVSIGAYPMAVQRRDGLVARLGLPRLMAMAVAAFSVLRRPPQLQVTLASGDQPDSTAPAILGTPLLFIGNNRYGTNALAPQRRARLDEGRLLVLAPGPLHRLPLARLLWHALTGSLHGTDTMATRWTREVTIEARLTKRFSRRMRRLAVGMDGERVVLQPPLTLRCLPGALNVRAPAAPDP